MLTMQFFSFDAKLVALEKLPSNYMLDFKSLFPAWLGKSVDVVLLSNYVIVFLDNL